MDEPIKYIGELQKAVYVYQMNRSKKNVKPETKKKQREAVIAAAGRVYYEN